MSKRIQFDEIDWIHKDGGFNLFVVRFKDNAEQSYEWAPKWKDLSEIFSCIPATEALNRGGDWIDAVQAALAVIAEVANSLNAKGARLDIGIGDSRHISVQMKEPTE